MITYITAFIFYTLAMIGILLIGFVIYKKTFISTKTSSSGLIKVLDVCPIAPKKNLMVVKVKNEKFLIASGAEHTTFLSKITSENPQYLPDKSQVIKALEKEETKNQNIEMNNQLIARKNELRFDDRRQKSSNDNSEYSNHLRKIQQQFNELYEKEDTPIKNEKAPNRHEMIQKLLKELNETDDTNRRRY